MSKYSMEKYIEVIKYILEKTILRMMLQNYCFFCNMEQRVICFKGR